MAAKERNERYDVPPEGALILIHGRVHEVTKTWEGTGPRIGEKAGYYTRHDPGDGTAPTKHVHDEGAPWRPATGQPRGRGPHDARRAEAADRRARPPRRPRGVAGRLGGRGGGAGGDRPRVYPLDGLDIEPGDSNPFEFFAVEKMKFKKIRNPETKKLEEERSTVIYNSRITVSGIPTDAYRYMVGSRSAVEWIMERYQVGPTSSPG